MVGGRYHLQGIGGNGASLFAAVNDAGDHEQEDYHGADDNGGLDGHALAMPPRRELCKNKTTVLADLKYS